MKEEKSCSPFGFERETVKPSMEAIVEKAVRVLSRDGLVVYPTETVYGLGGDALSEIAVYKVYEAKQRLAGKPISVAVSDLEMIEAIAYVDEFAERFIQKFLPGPITVVLPVKRCLPSDLSGGTGSIGVRYPDNSVALAIISGLDGPVTSTSANISGQVSPVTADQVNVPHDYLIDGGVLPGTPSTVVNLASRKVERAGAEIDEVVKFLREEK